MLRKDYNLKFSDYKVGGKMRGKKSVSVLTVLAILICVCGLNGCNSAETMVEEQRNAALNYERAYILLSEGKVKEAISEIRRGAKKDFYQPPLGSAMGLSEQKVREAAVDPERFSTIVREQLERIRAFQTLADKLISQGQTYQKEQKFSQAIDNYQVVIRFGKHLASGDFTIIKQLVGIGFQYSSYQYLKYLYEETGALDEVKKIRKKLEELDAKIVDMRDRVREKHLE